MAVELNESSFQAEIIDFPGVALVDFWAPWCGPCKMMGPIVENLSRKFEGKVKITKVNVEENQDLAGKFNILSIPSILFFKGGQVIYTHVGATDEANLEKQINQYLLS